MSHSKLCADLTTICHNKLPFKLRLTSNWNEIKDSDGTVHLYYNTKFNEIQTHSECHSQDVLSKILEFGKRFTDHSRTRELRSLNEYVFKSTLFGYRGGYERAYAISVLNFTYVMDDLIEVLVLANNFHHARLFVTALKALFDSALQKCYNRLEDIVADFKTNLGDMDSDISRDANCYMEMCLYLIKEEKRGLFETQIDPFNQTFISCLEMYLDHEFPIYESIQHRPPTWDEYRRKRWLSTGAKLLAVLCVGEKTFDWKYVQDYDSFFALFGQCLCFQNDILSLNAEKSLKEPMNSVVIAMNTQNIGELEAVKTAGAMANKLMLHLESTYEMVPPPYRPIYQKCFQIMLHFFDLATMPRYGWRGCN